jgi:hypothetical protein
MDEPKINDLTNAASGNWKLERALTLAHLAAGFGGTSPAQTPGASAASLPVNEAASSKPQAQQSLKK